MSNIAEGLKYIHSQHIIHRDLKCNNYEQESTLKPVLIDFGKALLTLAVMKYRLTETWKQQFRAQHKHIAPDLRRHQPPLFIK